MIAQATKRKCPLRLEPLERRDLMTAVSLTAFLSSNSSLLVLGTTTSSTPAPASTSTSSASSTTHTTVAAPTGLAADLNSAGQLTIAATSSATGTTGMMIREINGQISVDGITGSVAASSVKSIVITCNSGNDLILLNSASVKGQQALAAVPITIKGGAGSDDVRLAAGTDVYFSGTSTTLSITNKGVATLNGKALTWFDQNVHDTALVALGDADLTAGSTLTRNEMLAMLNQVAKQASVSQTDFSDLKAIVGNSSLFGTANNYVQVLAQDVVLGNVANATYQGAKLGNLAVGTTAANMTKLVDKWFLGTDLPTGTSDWGPTYGYAQASGQLFVSGAAYTDINQGGLGDCYFLSALAETAKLTPAAITSMFITNGDGTYTVRFYEANGKADYVTVNTMLPVDGSGRLVFDGMGSVAKSASNELWVALAEKAFVEWHQTGQEGEGSSSLTNQYTAISGGYMGTALSEVTGRKDVMFNSTTSSTSFTAFVSAFNAGNLLEFGSVGSPTLAGVVGDHAYAVVGYNATNKTVTLFNPWGMNNGQAPGTVTLTWAQIGANFAYYDKAV